MRNNDSTLNFWPLVYYWYPLLKTWRNQVKIKNRHRFLSNTRGITLLHSIFDVLTINGNLYWKRGRIDLNSKTPNSFLVNSCCKSMPIFYFNSIPPFLQQWLPIIIETSKIQCRMVIPLVLDENQSLLLNLSQHGLQIASDIWLIIKE